jgi:signal peptidase I
MPALDSSGDLSALPTEASLQETSSLGGRQSTTRSILRELIETVLLTLVIFLLIRTVVQNFRVDGLSMEPNFHDGQFLLINKLAYRLGEPQRGDVIVFRYPRDPSRDFIKRVVGLPGETVDIVDGQVYINGQPLDEFPDVQRAAYSSSSTVLGPDELFVMGDNRPNSSDSHSWGPLPRDLVIGKVVLSYWPPSTWGLIKTPTTEDGAVSAGSG